jgi:Ca2+-dependent lipid-binding protein
METSRLDEETKDLSRRISTHIERELEINQATEEIVVRVIRCNNLCPTDTIGLVKSSDPYVQLAVGPTSRKRRWRNKTPVKRQTLNPVWTVDNTFSFHVPMRNNKIEDDDKILKLQVFDADLLGTDDFVGEV